MLIPSSYKSFGVHEHIFRTKEGFLLLIRFEVTEINGRVRGRIVSVCPVNEEVTRESESHTIFALPDAVSRKAHERINFEGTGTVSPYPYLGFLVSQMTRAPAFK